MPASWIEQVWDEAINSNDANMIYINRGTAEDSDASSEQDVEVRSESSERSNPSPRYSPESIPDLDTTGADDLPDGEGTEPADQDPNSMGPIQRIDAQLATERERDEDGLSVFNADSELSFARSYDSDFESESGDGSDEDSSSENEYDSDLAFTNSDAGSNTNQDEGIADERVSEESSPSQSSSDSDSESESESDEDEDEDEDDTEDDPDYDPNSPTEAEAAADGRYGWEPLRRMLEHAKTARHISLRNFNWKTLMIVTHACSRTSRAYQLELGLNPPARWRLGPDKMNSDDMRASITYDVFAAVRKLGRIHGWAQWSAYVGARRAGGLLAHSRVMQVALDALAVHRGEMEIRGKLRHARYLGKVMEEIEQVRDALIAAADEINRIPRTTEFFHDDTVTFRPFDFCTLCESRGQSFSPIAGSWGAVHQVQDLVVAVYDVCRRLVNDSGPEKPLMPYACEAARTITNANALFNACHPFVFRIERRLGWSRHSYFKELGGFRLHQLRALAMGVWAESINTQLAAGGLIKSGTGKKARVGRLAPNVYNGFALGVMLFAELRKRGRSLRRRYGISRDEIYRAIWF